MKQRVLPADVFDTLEFMAIGFGGIGADSLFEDDHDTPKCVFGMAATAVGDQDEDKEMFIALSAAGITVDINDTIVHRINRKKGFGLGNRSHRVTWNQYCTALNIVRGA